MRLKAFTGFDQNTELTALIKAISKVVGDEDLTWALFIRWLSDRLGKAGELDRHAERLIRDALSSLDATAIQYAAQTFSGAFVDIAANGWEAVKPTGVAGLFKKLRSVVGMGADSATH
jgi:hypothetical protein